MKSCNYFRENTIYNVVYFAIKFPNIFHSEIYFALFALLVKI